MAKLEGQLELSAVVAISISSMVGSGIFVLPGLAAGHAGPAVWLAYLVAGLFVLPAALSKAELAAAMPSSGGTYVYLNRSFGPLFGTISGLGLWLSLLLKGSFALLGIGVYLEVIFDIPVVGFALSLVAAIVALNIIGLKGVSRIQKVLTIISLAGLVILTAQGLLDLDPKLIDHPLPNGASGFLYAVAFVFVSYAGVTKVAAIAEEVKDPEKNIPRGILISLGVVMLVYAGVSFVLVGIVPFAELANDVRPIHTLADRLGGADVGIIFAIVAILTLASMANAALLSASRFPFAMSRDSLLPSLLQVVHAKHLTPMNAIVLSGAFMAAAIVMFDVERIAKAASTFIIMIYMAECVSVIVLRESNAAWYRPGFQSPWYPWTQIFGVLAGMLLLVVLGPFAAIAGGILAAPGAAFYLIYGRRHTKHRGVMSLRGRRAELVRPHTVEMKIPIDLARDRPDAEVVCALFGTERSAETVIELAAVLAAGARLEVVHVREVPEQTLLEAIGEEEPIVTSIRRRTQALAEAREIPIDFTTSASHDIAKSIADISGRLHCDWLVIEHGGRTERGITFGSPLGWLKDHVQANLAIFRDAGVRHIRKILAYPNRGSNDSLVAITADHLAEVHGATLTFIGAVRTGASDEQRQELRSYLNQMAMLCVVETEVVILEGKIREDEVARASASYDLLVVSETATQSVFGTLRGTRGERLAEMAVCSVLRLQAPRNRTHEAFERRANADNSDDITNMIRPGAVDAAVPPMKKDALFNHFARVFSASIPGLSAKQISACLWERERDQNTAIGQGLAIPHATIPDMSGTHLGIFVTTEPISYGAPDGQGVDVFFVTLGGPNDRHGHLAVLSSVSRRVRDSQLASRLRKANNVEQMMRALVETETVESVADST